MPDAVIILINLTLIFSLFYYILVFFKKRFIHNIEKLQTDITIISDNIQVLTNNVNNNIRSALLTILYEELTDLSNDTRIERSLWAYFKNKVSDVANAYYELKNMGLENLKEQGFSSHLLGSGTLELIFLNPDFPPDFTAKIDSINQKNYMEFKDAIFLEFNLNTTDDKIVIIKTVSTELFRKNVRTIYQAFKDSKHLIKSKDFIERYGKTTDKKFLFDHTFHLDKTFMKDLISNGKGGIERALQIIKETLTDLEKINEYTLHSARFNDFIQRDRINTTDESELPAIRKALLDFIDTL
jgi:hypothetical protein